jgi:hypothetical protein
MQREYQQEKRATPAALDRRRLRCFAVCFRRQRRILGALAVGMLGAFGLFQSPDQEFMLDAVGT